MKKLEAIISREDIIKRAGLPLEKIDICSLSVDSRDVSEGGAFFLLNRSRDLGKKYIAQAVMNGARVIFIEEEIPFYEVQKFFDSCSFLQVKNIRTFLAKVAQNFYPKMPENIVAITGTSGKTSVVCFLEQIWRHSAIKGASIGTIGVRFQGEEQSTGLTTPDPIRLHAALQDLAEKGVTHIAMEASSHGIDQSRLDGVKLSAAAFTNFGRDHLDYHETQKEYFCAKMRLFTKLLPVGKPAIIFADDAYSEKVIEILKKEERPLLTIGKTGKFINIKEIIGKEFSQSVYLTFKGKEYCLNFPLMGNFQLMNAVLALGIALALGIDTAVAFQAFEQLKGAPGRLELIGKKESNLPIYVDYAHKPEALETVLKTLCDFTKGRIILVFGCGGDRDKGKREIMGAIAQKFADVIIVTDDNPRSEDPAMIRKDILKGAVKALEIGDRYQAIKKAIALAKAGDSILVAGKGHEKGQILKDKTINFSDKEAIENILKENAC